MRSIMTMILLLDYVKDIYTVKIINIKFIGVSRILLDRS